MNRSAAEEGFDRYQSGFAPEKGDWRHKGRFNRPGWKYEGAFSLRVAFQPASGTENSRQLDKVDGPKLVHAARDGKRKTAYCNTKPPGFLIVHAIPRENEEIWQFSKRGAKTDSLCEHHLPSKEINRQLACWQRCCCPIRGIIPLRRLSHINREKIDAIREAVKELEKAGYIVRSRERDEKGRLRGADYVIYEQPQPREPEAATSGGQPPILDLPTLENPTLDNPRWKNLRRKNLRWKIQRN